MAAHGVQQSFLSLLVSAADRGCPRRIAPSVPQRIFAAGQPVFLCLGRAGLRPADAAVHCLQLPPGPETGGLRPSQADIGCGDGLEFWSAGCVQIYRHGGGDAGCSHGAAAVHHRAVAAPGHLLLHLSGSVLPDRSLPWTGNAPEADCGLRPLYYPVCPTGGRAHCTLSGSCAAADGAAHRL